VKRDWFCRRHRGPIQPEDFPGPHADSRPATAGRLAVALVQAPHAHPTAVARGIRAVRISASAGNARFWPLRAGSIASLETNTWRTGFALGNKMVSGVKEPGINLHTPGCQRWLGSESRKIRGPVAPGRHPAEISPWGIEAAQVHRGGIEQGEAAMRGRWPPPHPGSTLPGDPPTGRGRGERMLKVSGFRFHRARRLGTRTSLSAGQAPGERARWPLVHPGPGQLAAADGGIETGGGGPSARAPRAPSSLALLGGHHGFGGFFEGRCGLIQRLVASGTLPHQRWAVRPRVTLASRCWGLGLGSWASALGQVGLGLHHPARLSIARPGARSAGFADLGCRTTRS